MGVAADLTGKLRGEAYVGVTEREFDAASLGDITEPTFGGNLLYRPTALTSIQVGLNRDIQETTLSNASGFVQTVVNGRIEHAVRKNVLLGAEAAIGQNDYEGGTSNREDDTLQLGLDARYDFNRNVAASVGYEYVERDSNEANSSFTSNRFMTRLLGKF